MMESGGHETPRNSKNLIWNPKEKYCRTLEFLSEYLLRYFLWDAHSVPKNSIISYIIYINII